MILKRYTHDIETIQIWYWNYADMILKQYRYDFEIMQIWYWNNTDMILKLCRHDIETMQVWNDTDISGVSNLLFWTPLYQQ